MTYENLETIGKIKDVFPTRHLTQSDETELASPEEVYLTRVNINKDPGFRSVELFGEFGQEHVGQDIRLVESYDNPEDGLRRFTQQIYLNGKLEVDQAVVKRV